MNEQIRQLLKQATTNVNPEDREWVFSRVDQEKFAELIVEDIINLLESTNEIRHIAATTFTLSVVEGIIEKSINAITEHYGMKQHHRIKNERTMGRKVSSK